MADGNTGSGHNPREFNQGHPMASSSPSPLSPMRARDGTFRIRPSIHSHRSDASSSQQSRDRDPRSWNTQDARELSFDESTRLLPDDPNERTPRASISQDRSHDQSHSISYDRSQHQHQLQNPYLTLPRGVRHRTSMWSVQSAGPGARRATLVPRRSIAAGLSTGRDDGAESARNFSMAGPAPVETIVANQPYVDPGYAQLNPAYDQPSNARPVWGLAKPLPRVLRPGMIPTTSELHTELLHKRTQDSVDADIEQGKIEPTLRPDRIGPLLEDVRQERELQLVETFLGTSLTGGSRQTDSRQSPSPYMRRTSDATALYSPRYEAPIAEEEEGDSQQGFPGLMEAATRVEEASLRDLPYEDAVPLLAYEATEDEIHNLHTYWSVVRLRFREPLAEFLAITVQYTLGFSCNLAITVSGGRAGVGDTSDWGWGLAAMTAIYIAGGISGAHLNPAMSIMLYIYRGFPLSKIPSYVVAQVLGAFSATLIAFAIFQPGLIALNQPNLGIGGTANNFITSARADWVSNQIAFSTEVVGTTILAIVVLALGDDANAPPGAGMNAFIIGLVIVVLSIAFGWNTGLAMNPVRDFGPRLALFALGYGKELFTDGYWFKVAWLGPITGAILGGFLYDAAIFTGGESPVNYPAKRMKRATIKWKRRMGARFRRTQRKIKEVKGDVAYGTMRSS